MLGFVGGFLSNRCVARPLVNGKNVTVLLTVSLGLNYILSLVISY